MVHKRPARNVRIRPLFTSRHRAARSFTDSTTSSTGPSSRMYFSVFGLVSTGATKSRAPAAAAPRDRATSDRPPHSASPFRALRRGRRPGRRRVLHPCRAGIVPSIRGARYRRSRSRPQTPARRARKHRPARRPHPRLPGETPRAVILPVRIDEKSSSRASRAARSGLRGVRRGMGGVQEGGVRRCSGLDLTTAARAPQARAAVRDNVCTRCESSPSTRRSRPGRSARRSRQVPPRIRSVVAACSG